MRKPIHSQTSPPLCPFCVAEGGFSRMQERDKILICPKCGHTTSREVPDYQCLCLKCVKMRSRMNDGMAPEVA